MEQKICIDTDVAIAILKDEPGGRQFIELAEGREISITAISAYELQLRRNNLSEIHDFLAEVEILPFEAKAASHASAIMKEAEAKGAMPGLQDIFIAATCIAADRALVTGNRRHFQGIRGLKLV
ncbi:MAG: type II toxin-antitoxin system VapC family toxin [Nanoarchaeota archaeon]